MDGLLIPPIKLNFEGGDADEHRVDALQLGQSLAGTARIYNSVGNLYFEGIYKNSGLSKVRTQVGPPKEGSIFYLLYLFMLHGEMAVYPQLLLSLAELALPEFIRAMIAKKTGQDAMLSKALDMLEKSNERYHEVVRVGQDNDMQTRSSLIGVIDKLVSRNEVPLAQMAAPVGRSIKEIVQLPDNADPIEIDGPTAASLRSKKVLTVGEVSVFYGTITALDLTNGSIKISIGEDGTTLRGVVTDPALSEPGNIYSHSMDAVQPVELTAKPTFDELGSIARLYISDAKPANP